VYEEWVKKARGGYIQIGNHNASVRVHIEENNANFTLYEEHLEKFWSIDGSNGSYAFVIAAHGPKFATLSGEVAERLDRFIVSASAGISTFFTPTEKNKRMALSMSPTSDIRLVVAFPYLRVKGAKSLAVITGTGNGGAVRVCTQSITHAPDHDLHVHSVDIIASRVRDVNRTDITRIVSRLKNEDEKGEGADALLLCFRRAQTLWIIEGKTTKTVSLSCFFE